jgi:hypothetical protein
MSTTLWFCSQEEEYGLRGTGLDDRNFICTHCTQLIQKVDTFSHVWFILSFVILHQTTFKKGISFEKQVLIWLLLKVTNVTRFPLSVTRWDTINVSLNLDLTPRHCSFNLLGTKSTFWPEYFYQSSFLPVHSSGSIGQKNYFRV